VSGGLLRQAEGARSDFWRHPISLNWPELRVLHPEGHTKTLPQYMPFHASSAHCLAAYVRGLPLARPGLSVHCFGPGLTCAFAMLYDFTAKRQLCQMVRFRWPVLEQTNNTISRNVDSCYIITDAGGLNNGKRAKRDIQPPHKTKGS